MSTRNTPELGALLKELQDREIDLRLTKDGGLSAGPRSRITKSLKKRIKEHKQGIIAMILHCSGAPICMACLHPIRDTDPHVEVTEVGEGSRAHFHMDPECQEHGAWKVAQKTAAGKVVDINHVHVCGDADSGYDCEGGCFR